jgi:hypothetical protein
MLGVSFPATAPYPAYHGNGITGAFQVNLGFAHLVIMFPARGNNPMVVRNTGTRQCNNALTCDN